MTARAEPRLYFIIVDNRDKFLYQSLLLSPTSTEHVWGLRQHDEPIWSQLSPGDIICMMIENDHQFTIKGRINHLKIDPNVPKQWSANFRISMMKYLVYFDNVQHLRIPRGEIINYADDQTSKYVPGLHKIQLDKSSAIISKLLSSDLIINPALAPIDLNGPPDKIKCTTTRFIRDTDASQELKKLYKNRCQICNYRLEINPQTHYSEAHHIWPLHDGGDDDFSNMIVLCPTHHAEFDYGVICIDESGTGILNQSSQKIANLFVKESHTISSKNIKHNMSRMGLL